MRDRIGRTMLYAVGAAAAAGGATSLLGLALGLMPVEALTETILLDVGALLSGIALLRIVHTIKPGERPGDR